MPLPALLLSYCVFLFPQAHHSERVLGCDNSLGFCVLCALHLQFPSVGLSLGTAALKP